MIVRQAKLLNGLSVQYQAIDSAIRAAQFIRNKAIRLWRDELNVSKARLSLLCKELARAYPFAKKLNSMVALASTERAWNSISSFYRRSLGQHSHARRRWRSCLTAVVRELRKRVILSSKSILAVVEYKTSGWKLSAILSNY